MNWFSYNGVRSAERYIRISDKDIFSGPKYDSTVQSIPGRDGDLFCPGGRLGNVSLSYTCFVPAKTVAELEERLTDVKAWLYAEPDRYHELFDSYDTGFFAVRYLTANWISRRNAAKSVYLPSASPATPSGFSGRDRKS